MRPRRIGEQQRHHRRMRLPTQERCVGGTPGAPTHQPDQHTGTGLTPRRPEQSPMKVHMPAQVEDPLASTGGEDASEASARRRLLTEYGNSSPGAETVPVLRRVICDSRPPVDVRHLGQFGQSDSDVPVGRLDSGGRDWHWLSCLLSSSGWTRFVRCWRARTSLRWRPGWGCIGRRCIGGWRGI